MFSKKYLGTIFLLSIMAKVTGFIRELSVAYQYGASYQTDAFFTAMTILMIVYNFVSVAVTVSLIPKFGELHQDYGKEKMMDFSNNILTILGILSILITVILLFFVNDIVRVIVPHFDSERYELTVQLTRISLIAVIFMTINAASLAILQILDVYIPLTIASLSVNIPVIIYLSMFDSRDIHILIVAVVFGYGLQMLVQALWLYFKGYKYRFIFNLKDENLKDTVTLILPSLVLVAANQINTIIERSLASQLPYGSISAYNYANTLNIVAYGVFAVNIASMYYSKISKAAQHSYGEVKDLMSAGISKISFFMIPLSMFTIYYAEDIVKTAFGYGKFNVNSIKMTADILRILSIGMITNGVRDILDRGFYAMQMPKISVGIALIGIASNIVINIFLIKRCGIMGIAIGMVTASVISCLLLVSVMRKVLVEKKYFNMYIGFFKSLICVLLILAIWNFFDINLYGSTNFEFVKLFSNYTVLIMLYLILMQIVDYFIAGGKIVWKKFW